MSQEHPNPERKWRNMRYMSYMATIHAFTLPIYVAVDAVPAFLLFDGAIVGAYMGFSTARDGWGKQ